MMNWPAFHYGFKLLGAAALLTLLSLWNGIDEYSRRAIVSNLMFFLLAVFIITVVVSAIRKQVPIKETVQAEEAVDEAAQDS